MRRMGVAVRYVRDRRQWAVFSRVDGKRRSKFFGDGPAGESAANEFAAVMREENALAGQWMTSAALPCDDVLRGWLVVHRPTLARSTEETVGGLIENHLAPFFRNRDLRTIDQTDLIKFVDEKLRDKKSAALCINALSLLRRVCELHVDAGLMQRNPAKGCKALVNRVAKRYETPKRPVDSWTADEARKLIAKAWEIEKRVAPALEIAFATGMRRGEILALKWCDIDFARNRITVDKSLVRGHVGTTKSGRVRVLPLAASLAADLQGLRREQQAQAPWSDDLPVCPSRKGGHFDEHNFSRAWRRLRRKCTDVRPLAFHCTRHTFATLALEAGRSIKWVADVLGHADPTITLRTYAHALNVESDGLDFVPLEPRSSVARKVARSGTQIRKSAR